MYNLFVSGNAEEWDGSTFEIEESRCVNEYTSQEINETFGSLNEAAVAKLKKFPCIFAYETHCEKAPRFGALREVVKRQGRVRISYEIQDVTPFLAPENLSALAFNLDIAKWEMNRTHWAVKNVDLPKELKALDIILPSWARSLGNAVNVNTHIFDVALSFPGELRHIVEPIARELERRIGPNSYFYDNNYTAQLARPSLDTLLQDIYGNRSRLIVVFLSADYQNKRWCGIEFRAIREIIHNKDHQKVMYVRMDDGSVDGVFQTDGYVDGRRYSAGEIAAFIEERVGLLSV